MVAQIVLMADTVQKLHGQDDLMLLRQRDKAPQPLLAVLPALQVRCAVTPAGEANQVGQSSVRHHRDHLLITGDQLVMQGRIIETSIYPSPAPCAIATVRPCFCTTGQSSGSSSSTDSIPICLQISQNSSRL